MHPELSLQSMLAVCLDSSLLRYGQEEPGERLEILQQPLALGYLTSTARTGAMPRWFWSSAPHLESNTPVFLKSALHINCANLTLGGDDGLVPQSSSGRVHSLDSNYTTDVLRSVNLFIYFYIYNSNLPSVNNLFSLIHLYSLVI